MITIAITLFFISLICLAFASTRWIGVVSLALLFFLYPLVFTVLLVLAGIVFYFIHVHKTKHNQRSKHHVQPKLPSSRD
ncbi:hypothetical protein EDC63_10611 [Sulfurirhabdus autotrophica]|uniref:Uncharacterized protein n=1 Tax=Sulfurirhabdus autotrophica TaxID=1706046 RepID=A0A4R3Y4H7_9PROT|nr:hypothetical protein EDC63_10611 [Sulfurirhabdus autotrophica]